MVPAMGLPRSAPSESTEVATWPGVLRVGDLGERFDTGNRWISFKGVSYFRYIFVSANHSGLALLFLL